MRALVLCTAMSLGAASLSAGQITVNFSGLSEAGSGLKPITNPHVQDGFTFTNSGTLGIWRSADGFHPAGGDAATSLVPYSAGSSATIAAADRSPFSMISIDLAPWGAGSGVSSYSLGFTGHLAGGGVVNHTFTVANSWNLGGTPVLTTYSFAGLGFANLSSVTFVQGTYAPTNGSAFQYNNVVVDTGVPEPSSMAMFFGVLVLLLPRLRKRVLQDL